MTSYRHLSSPKETKPTHRVGLSQASAAVKVATVAADEGAIYHVFFHGLVRQEGKNKLKARAVLQFT